MKKMDAIRFTQSIQACKTRRVLNLQQALQIFEIKRSKQSSGKYGRQSAAGVSRSFGVSEKTVRDIWVGRTWEMHLDPARAAKAGDIKLPGRPKRSETAEHECHPVNQHLALCLYNRTIDS